MSHPRLLSVNVAKMRLIVLGRETVKTGIYKYPVEGTVEVRDEQVGGDRQGDYTVHGGPDKAVYAYANEDYRWWSQELGGRDVEPGLFGENLTTAGHRPERGRGRRPLARRRRPARGLRAAHPVQQARLQDGGPAVRQAFAQANRPGAYLRIIEPGELGSGDPIEVVSEPGNGVTMALFSRAILGERELLPKLLEAEALAPRHARVGREPAR